MVATVKDLAYRGWMTRNMTLFCIPLWTCKPQLKSQVDLPQVSPNVLPPEIKIQEDIQVIFS